MSVWVKPVSALSQAVMVVSMARLGSSNASVALDLDFVLGHGYCATGCVVRDLWAHTPASPPFATAFFDVTGIEPHDSAFITFTRSRVALAPQ